jgi:hypothetical protein
LINEWECIDVEKNVFCLIGLVFMLTRCSVSIVDESVVSPTDFPEEHVIPTYTFTPATKVPESTTVTKEQAMPTEIIPEITEVFVGTTEPLIGAQLPPNFAGLLYSTKEGLWLVEPDGRSVLLINQPDAVLSPDGSKVIYCDGELLDIWLADLVSGVRRNLTNTPDRTETDPSWWPSHDGVVVFLADSTFGDGHPGVVNLDGSGYRLLDEEKGGPVAFSPDGSTIAFGCCGNSGILYDWKEGPEVFDPLDYGIHVDKLYRSAWSPDGNKLAWVVGGYMTSSEMFQSANAIFNLESKKAKLVHIYSIQGGAMVPHYLVWSPDGDWLAFSNYLEVVESSSPPHLWVVRADGGEEHYIGRGSNPIWSPDGQWLAYNLGNEAPDNIWDRKVWAVQSGAWNETTELPVNGDLEGWFEENRQ